MRPVILIAVLVAVVIAAVAAFRYGAGRLDGVVASTVERYGSAVTGTAVDVDGVALALASGRAELAGLTIDNPKGYDTGYAVRIDHTSVALDVGSLAGDVPVIEELTLGGALINAEQRERASNLTDIQQHATASAGDAPPSAEPGRIIVKRFRLEDARVRLTSEYLEEPEELPLRDVVVENIGAASGGATYAEAAEAMLLPVIAAARSAVGERLQTAAAAAAREELQDEVQDLENRLDERVDELLDGR